jgi:hypothetical protein
MQGKRKTNETQNAIADPKYFQKKSEKRVERRESSSSSPSLSMSMYPTSSQIMLPSGTEETSAPMQSPLLEAEHNGLRLDLASVILALYFAGFLTAGRRGCRKHSISGKR